MLQNFFNQVTDKDNNQIDNNLEKLNIVNLYNEKKESIKCCPRCQSTYFIKHGTYKGLQRFKCKNEECSCTFSVTTNSPWSYSKKNINLWIKYLELMMEGRSIRYCAKYLKINIATSFYWRHKILFAQNSFVEPKILTGCVEMFKVNFKQNFKGCRNIPPHFLRNRQTIWVASAIDVNNNILSRPISQGYFDYAFVEKSFYSKIDENAFINIYTDTNLCYLARKHNKNLTPCTSKNDLIIKSFGVNIKRWLYIFRGIATKYLWSYLSWYIILFKNIHHDIVKLIKLLTLENTFKSNKNFIKTEVCIL
ncbi:IS1 family transposase [Clostridium gasigenes]|uniref:IS1 family transposase n=1 Tax=Clostridium gasigenes TaxID=94869 RepID=UPI00162A94F4|nr:IS1 family transposase [Clostridium gasigenes]MBB6623990.1 IS1 family transposase [Clostridium gasigenes]